METYNIDTETAFKEFVEYLQEEKPEKTFKGDIIEFESFQVKVLPEYQVKLKKLLGSEYEASKEPQKSGFDISAHNIEIVEKLGYSFVTFKD